MKKSEIEFQKQLQARKKERKQKRAGVELGTRAEQIERRELRERDQAFIDLAKYLPAVVGLVIVCGVVIGVTWWILHLLYPAVF